MEVLEMTYEQAMEKVNSRLRFGIKPGLERVSALLEKLGNPQKQLKFVHVAGTNGKGTTCTLIAGALKAAGYRTGLYTSPYVLEFRERFQIDGQMIPEEELIEQVQAVSAAADEMEASGEAITEFEFITAMALLWFARRSCDIVVLEVGLGGRFDATNVIDTPEAAAIASISLDHTAVLGDTVEQIAFEKAGIIKKSIPVIIGEADARYNEVFEQTAAANKSRVIYAEREFVCEEHRPQGEYQHFRLRRTRDGQSFDLELDLLGDYQCRNIVTASAAVDFLHEETPLTISRRAYLEGMKKAAANTSLMGRWQKLGEAPLTICDTGHNAHGIAWVAQQLKETPHRNLYCVIGFVRDKDLAHILPLLPHEAHYLFTQAQSERALPAAELTAKAAIYGLHGDAVGQVSEALARARELADPEDLIFVGGSTYVVAEVL